MRTAPLFISISGRLAAGRSVWRPQLTRGTWTGACCSAEPRQLPPLPPHPTTPPRLRLSVCVCLSVRRSASALCGDLWSAASWASGLPARPRAQTGASSPAKDAATPRRPRAPGAGAWGASERACVRGPGQRGPSLGTQAFDWTPLRSPYCPQRRDRGGPRQCVGDAAAPRAEGRGGKGGSTSSPLNPDPPGTRDPGGPTRFVI